MQNTGSRDVGEKSKFYSLAIYIWYIWNEIGFSWLKKGMNENEALN